MKRQFSIEETSVIAAYLNENEMVSPKTHDYLVRISFWKGTILGIVYTILLYFLVKVF